MKVTITEYNPDWPHQFERIKSQLLRILKDLSPRIEHIGSTSVPGLAAKPIIDIAVGINHIEDLDKTVQPMIDNNYFYYEAFNAAMPDRRLYVGLKDVDNESRFPSVFKTLEEIPHDEINSLRLSHVHTWQFGSPAWNRHIAFREYLRAHPKVCAQYARLKKQLGREDWQHGMAYNKVKEHFMKAEEAKALKWIRSKKH